jgi:NAD(P)-dependent dehydrogenase (short-subunit alcohol dehydrogenase family)
VSSAGLQGTSRYGVRCNAVAPGGTPGSWRQPLRICT